LKGNVDLSGVDFNDTDTIVNMIPGSELYFALYNGSASETRKLMLLVYFNGREGKVYLTAPWLGVGKVSYSVDLASLIGPAAAVAFAEGEGQGSADPLGKVANLVLNERGIGVVVTGALLAESLNLLSLDENFDLAAILEEVNFGIGLNDGLSVNLGAVLKGADITAGITGLGFGVDNTLDLEGLVFADAEDKAAYVNVGSGLDIKFNSISAGITATFDLETSTFEFDASETMKSIADVFPLTEDVESLIRSLSLFLAAQGNVGAALKTPFTVRLDFNLFETLEFVLSVTNADGEVLANVMYDGGEDDLYVELPILGTPKTKISGTGIMNLIPDFTSTASAAATNLACGCTCPACLAAGSCGKSASNLKCSASCDCTCHLPDLECGCMNPACKTAGSCFHLENGEQVLNDGCNCSVHAKKPLIEILNDVIDYVALDGSRGVIGVVTKGNALATLASLLSLRIVVPELVLGAKVNVRDLGVEVSVTAYKENAKVFDLGIALGDIVIEFSPRALVKNTADYRDWKDLKMGVALDADV
ncbi:MAG: hypothetical protein IK037_03605, partial [Clostridia bacterium]|nr:hypothetical protein [Clostridia bacterium]